jgi:hypothetical protein
MPADEREDVLRAADDVRASGYSGRVSVRGIAVLAVPVIVGGRMVASLGLLSTRDVIDVGTESKELVALRECAEEIGASMAVSGNR